MEAVLETDTKPMELLMEPVSLNNETPVDTLQQAIERSEDSQSNVFIKSEPVDEIVPAAGEKVNQIHEPAADHCQDTHVKFEPALNEVRDLADELLYKTPENGSHTVRSDFHVTGGINDISDINKEELDDCAQATCKNIVESIEQQYEEMDETIFGNLDSSRNGFNKETLRMSIEMVELVQTGDERVDDRKKLNLKEVLNSVDHFESSHKTEVKTEGTDIDESIVLEDYTSGSETDPYGCDSDSDVQKTDEPIETIIGDDSVHGEKDRNVTVKALLDKFNIPECCVHLKVIDNSLTIKDCTANAETSETEKVYKVNDKQHERLKKGSVQCKVCSMNLKNVKSLLIHSRIHLKFNLMCCFCGPLFTYHTITGLEKHMAKHGKSPFECKICGRIFPNQRKLKNHGIKHDIKPFNCNLCPKAYYSEKLLEDHLRTHSNERPYICGICSLTFTSSVRLGWHTAYSHGNQDRKFLCKICGKGFKRKEHMERHVRHVHSNVRPFVCKICGKSYKGKGSLSLHNRSHTGEKVSCDTCGRKFRDPGDLKKHKRVVHDKIKNFKCDSCGLLCANQSNLTTHIKRKHSDPSAIVKKFKCEQCDWRFEKRCDLKSHMKRHIKTANYKCPHCEKCFKCKDYLEKHVRSIHYRSDEKISCPECPQTFTAKEGLRRHMRLHKFGRQYHCKICKATYIYRDHLKQHIQYTHMGIKPPQRQCKICGKHVTVLKKHLETHNPEKTFNCEECGRGFRTALRLEMHSRSHWGTKPFNCRMCDSAFTRYENFKMHLKRAHNKTVDDKEDSYEEDDSDNSESE